MLVLISKDHRSTTDTVLVLITKDHRSTTATMLVLISKDPQTHNRHSVSAH